MIIREIATNRVTQSKTQYNLTSFAIDPIQDTMNLQIDDSDDNDDTGNHGSILLTSQNNKDCQNGTDQPPPPSNDDNAAPQIPNAEHIGNETQEELTQLRVFTIRNSKTNF